MKRITKYQSDDGTEFKTEDACLDYENLCGEMIDLMGKLVPRPDDCDFSNGSGYIQQKEHCFMFVRNEILKIAQRSSDEKWISQSIEMGLDADPSWAGRIISECCPHPVYQAWNRISCTTNDFREYGQQYYRNNPSETKQVCLNQ